jgi:hypothetical protein
MILTYFTLTQINTRMCVYVYIYIYIYIYTHTFHIVTIIIGLIMTVLMTLFYSFQPYHVPGVDSVPSENE